MSEPNTEIVRRALHARRSEFAELFVPSVRLDLSERIFDPAVYDGYDGILHWRAEVGEICESYLTTAEEPSMAARQSSSSRTSEVAAGSAASRSIAWPPCSAACAIVASSK